jgi:hypothetical protein
MDGLGAFGALLHRELHVLAFPQGPVAFHLNGRVVDKDVFAILTLDKAVPSAVVEPSDSACFLFAHLAILSGGIARLNGTLTSWASSLDR